MPDEKIGVEAHVAALAAPACSPRKTTVTDP
jgi:hypothetical protein